MNSPLLPAICILASLTLTACGGGGGGGRVSHAFLDTQPEAQPEALPPPPDLKDTGALLNFVLADGQAHLAEEEDPYADEPVYPIHSRSFEKDGKKGAVTLHEHKAGVPTMIAVTTEGEKAQFKILDNLPVPTGRANAYYDGVFTASYSLDGGKTWHTGEGGGAHVYVDTEAGHMGATGGVTNSTDPDESLGIGVLAKVENGKISTGESTYTYFHIWREGELIQEYKPVNVEGVLIGEADGPPEGLAATLEHEEGDFIANAGLVATFYRDIDSN